MLGGKAYGTYLRIRKLNLCWLFIMSFTLGWIHTTSNVRTKATGITGRPRWLSFETIWPAGDFWEVREERGSRMDKTANKELVRFLKR